MRNAALIWLGVIAWVFAGVAVILAIVAASLPDIDESFLGPDVPNTAKLAVEAWEGVFERAALPFLAAWIAVFAIRFYLVPKAEPSNASVQEIETADPAPAPTDEEKYLAWLK